MESKSLNWLRVAGVKHSIETGIFLNIPCCPNSAEVKATMKPIRAELFSGEYSENHKTVQTPW